MTGTCEVADCGKPADSSCNNCDIELCDTHAHTILYSRQTWWEPEDSVDYCPDCIDDGHNTFTNYVRLRDGGPG